MNEATTSWLFTFICVRGLKVNNMLIILGLEIGKYNLMAYIIYQTIIPVAQTLSGKIFQPQPPPSWQEPQTRHTLMVAKFLRRFMVVLW